MERRSRNHSTTLLLSTKQNTEDKERKQKLFSYALIVHKTIYTRQREKAINIQLRPYCQTQNPSSSHTQKLIPKNNILY